MQCYIKLFLFLGQLWQLFEVSQILEFLRYILTLFLTSGLVHSYYLDESIPSFSGFPVIVFVFIAFHIEISVSIADPVQTPRLAASELGQHCLHNTHKSVSSLKRAKARFRLAFKMQDKHCLILLPKQTPRARISIYKIKH